MIYGWSCINWLLRSLFFVRWYTDYETCFQISSFNTVRCSVKSSQLRLNFVHNSKPTVTRLAKATPASCLELWALDRHYKEILWYSDKLKQNRIKSILEIYWDHFLSCEIVYIYISTLFLMASLVKQRDEYGSFLTSETGKTIPKTLYRKTECSAHMSLLLAVALSHTIVCVIIIRRPPSPPQHHAAFLKPHIG